MSTISTMSKVVRSTLALKNLQGLSAAPGNLLWIPIRHFLTGLILNLTFHFYLFQHQLCQLDSTQAQPKKSLLKPHLDHCPMKIGSSGISMEDKIGDWREPKREAIGTKLRKLYKKVQQNEYERQMTDKESFEVWKTWMKSVWIYRTQSPVFCDWDFTWNQFCGLLGFQNLQF